MEKIGELSEIRGEVKLKWKIKNFFLLSDKADMCYESSEFSFSGRSWKIWIYPNGHSTGETVGWISLYIKQQTPLLAPTTVCFSLSLKAVDDKYYLKNTKTCVFDDKNDGWGIPRFILRSKLIKRKSKLLPSDVLTILCTLKISDINDIAEKTQLITNNAPHTVNSRKRKISDTSIENEIQMPKEPEVKRGLDYPNLLALNNVDLVQNVEQLECPVCFVVVGVGEGVILQECLHSFCKECLAGAVQFSETAVVKCPFQNNEYSCGFHLQEKEVKALVTPEVYEKHLQRSVNLAEKQARNSFHCKTPDCTGWCLLEDEVNFFRCPVCMHVNCLTCAAIHEGRNCQQYQDEEAFRRDNSQEAKKTREYLLKKIDSGKSMRCPLCTVILMKKDGCDWLICSMCRTEICWVTKGPRWGPGGKGDTSAGCQCMLHGKRCHPECKNCH